MQNHGATTGTIVVGVDTHNDAHVAVALDHVGRRLGTLSVPADDRGYEQLVSWVRRFGDQVVAGVEGTASFGAGLCRWLQTHDVQVFEVARPNRQRRRRLGKSDTVDAENAARAALAGDATCLPKAGSGLVEMIRVLRVARRSAEQQRTAAINQLRGLTVTAPDALRAQLRQLTAKRLVDTAARLRPGSLTDPASAAKFALRSLAHRVRHLDDELATLDAQLAPLVAQAAPDLVAVKGVGTQTAAALLVAAATTATGCAMNAPSPASAAAPLWTPPRGGSSATDPTAAATARPTAPCTSSSAAAWPTTPAPAPTCNAASGTARPAAKPSRCLKRYLARELFPLITTALP